MRAGATPTERNRSTYGFHMTVRSLRLRTFINMSPVRHTISVLLLLRGSASHDDLLQRCRLPCVLGVHRLARFSTLGAPYNALIRSVSLWNTALTLSVSPTCALY